MDKKEEAKLRSNGVSEDAITALAAGEGNRSLGTNNKIAVGFEGKVIGVDFRRAIIQHKDDDLTPAEFRELSDEEKLDHGRKTQWFELITTNGSVSLTTLFGIAEMQTFEFWDTKLETNKSAVIEGIDKFEPSKIFTPSCRNVRVWIEGGYDGLKGKTLRAVARKEWNNGNFDTKAVAFYVE